MRKSPSRSASFAARSVLLKYTMFQSRSEPPAHFYDLFLDVTVDPDGNTRLLDRDELDAALSEGVITAEQHSLAVSVAIDLQKAFPSMLNKLDEVCKSFLSA